MRFTVGVLKTKKGITTMKNIFTKVLGTSMALTLVLASAAPATAPAVKSAKAEAVKAAVVETEDAAEAKTDLGILEAVEKKIAEKAEIKTEAKETAKAEAAEEVKSEAKAEVKAEAEETVKAEAPLAEVAIERAEAEEAAELELKAPELAAQTAAKAEAPEAAAETAQAEEAAAPAPATEAAEEEPVVKVWNISATEADNVEMKFVANTKGVDVDVQKGEVTISGEGAMEESVYTNFLSVEKYIEATKAAFEEEYGVTVRLDYDHEIEDVIELDRTLKVYAETSNGDVEEGDALTATPEMLENIDLSQFLEFSPTKITINEGITSISDCAFVACADLTEIVLPKTIETIGDRAFLRCTSLKRVVIPEDAKIVTGAFYNCTGLDTVVLASDDDYAAPDNFAGQSVKTMPEDQVQRLIDGI